MSVQNSQRSIQSCIKNLKWSVLQKWLTAFSVHLRQTKIFLYSVNCFLLMKTGTAWKMSEFGVFLVRIFPHSDWILCISPYSIRMRENTDQNNSEYEHFLRSVVNSFALQIVLWFCTNWMLFISKKLRLQNDYYTMSEFLFCSSDFCFQSPSHKINLRQKTIKTHRYKFWIT